LLDLQAARALASWLDHRPQVGQEVFAPGQPEPLGPCFGPQHQIDVDEFLWAAMGCLAEIADEAKARAVYRPRWAALYALGDAQVSFVFKPGSWYPVSLPFAATAPVNLC
jgi:hypothetical protein